MILLSIVAEVWTRAPTINHAHHAFCLEIDGTPRSCRYSLLVYRSCIVRREYDDVGRSLAQYATAQTQLNLTQHWLLNSSSAIFDQVSPPVKSKRSNSAININTRLFDRSQTLGTSLCPRWLHWTPKLWSCYAPYLMLIFTVVRSPLPSIKSL